MGRPRTYYINEKFFNEIDTNEKAYWLGFLYADGYITKSGFGIALKIGDFKHLEKMLKSMNSNYIIKIYKNTKEYSYSKGEYCRLICSSKNMKSKLISYGLVPNKSVILQPPKIKFKNNDLRLCFIRGFFDGNGCVSGLKKSTYALKITSTDAMLDWIANSLGYKYNKLYKRRPTDIVSSLEIRGMKNIRKYGNLLYKNSDIYLDRKYEKITKILKEE